MPPKRRLIFALLVLPIYLLVACASPGFNLPQPTRSTIPTRVTLTPGATAVNSTDTATLPAATRTASAPIPTAATPSQVTPTSAAPSPTVGPSPTSDHGFTVTLSIPPAPPANSAILPQVGIFQTGGGGGYSSSDCETKSGEIRWCGALQGGSLPRTETYRASACGFGAGDLTALVQFPDGHTQSVEVAGSPLQCREVIFLPAPGSPLGIYQINLSLNATHLSDSFQLIAPQEPTGALLQNCAWLAGLPVGQPFRLLAFGLVPPDLNSAAPDFGLTFWHFLTEASLQPDATGNLLACPAAASQEQYAEFMYLAYPEGGAPILFGDEELLQQFQGVCANGPLTRLAAGKKARITSKNLPLFSDPGLNAQPLTQLAPGAEVSVLNGPVCPPQGPWTWLVKTAANQTGWLAETDQTAYFLEPQP